MSVYTYMVFPMLANAPAAFTALVVAVLVSGGLLAADVVQQRGDQPRCPVTGLTTYTAAFQDLRACSGHSYARWDLRDAADTELAGRVVVAVNGVAHI